MARTLTGNGSKATLSGRGAPVLLGSEEPLPEGVYISESMGVLSFPEDSNGFSVPDYSYSGYLNRGIDLLPTLNTEYSVPADSGDDKADLTGHLVEGSNTEPAAEANWLAIQNAIDYVATLPSVDGFKGAVQIGAGDFYIENYSQALTIPDGVVLRGAGEGSTTLINRGHDNSPNYMILLGTTETDTKWEPFNDGVLGTQWDVTDSVVKVGATQLSIDHSDTLQVGDEIIIRHPSTAAWVTAMADGGGNPVDPPEGSTGSNSGNEWNLVETYYPQVPLTFGPVTIAYWREVVAIDGGNTDIITLDAPIFCDLNKSLSQSFAYKFTRTITEKCGIEEMTIDVDRHQTDLATETNASYFSCVQFGGVKNGFVRNMTIKNFRRSGVNIEYSKNITCHNVDCVYPHSVISSSERYNFNQSGGQQCHYEDCLANYGRHNYISNGWAADSGSVYLNCTSDNAYGTVEFGHQRLSQGALFDNCVFETTGAPEVGTSVPFANQLFWFGTHGDNSAMQGFASVNCMAWRCDISGGPDGARAVVNQTPAGVAGLNFTYGCTESAPQTADPLAGWIEKHPVWGNSPYNYEHYAGDGQGIDMGVTGTMPSSLYEQQLFQRLNP